MNWVTVIVPVYNMENYIDRCIASVLQQTDRNFVLLLLIDGATDDSLSHCLSWAKQDERIVVVQKRNEGLGETRNLGIRMADTEYMTFLDADDWWSPDYLEQMHIGTEQGKNDIVLCDIDFVQEQEEERFSHRDSVLRFLPGKIEINKEKHLLSRVRTFACGKLYRRSLFLDYQIKQPAHAYEDVSSVPFIVAKAQSIYYIPGARYHYLRNRKGSIVNQFCSLRALVRSLEELRQRFVADGSWERYYNQLRQIFWGQLCFVVHCLEGRFAEEQQRERDDIMQKMQAVVFGTFPELKRLMTLNFFTEDVLIKRAIGHLVLDERQIVLQKDNADCIVTFLESKPEGEQTQWIGINRRNIVTEDEESSEWNVADEIFAEIFRRD